MANAVDQAILPDLVDRAYNKGFEDAANRYIQDNDPYYNVKQCKQNIASMNERIEYLRAELQRLSNAVRTEEDKHKAYAMLVHAEINRPA